MNYETIPLASAMPRLALGCAIWWVALGFAIPGARQRLRRGAAVAAAIMVVGALVGPPLIVTYDSTVDFALGKLCTAGACTTLGVGASAGGFEGGVLWDWILAALFAVDESPNWMRLAFLGVNALGAGIVSMLPADRRAGFGAAAIFFVTSFGLGPGYIAFHPTLAPVAIVPAILLAARRFAEPDDAPATTTRALLLGASYGVGLGVYIAALFLGTVLVLGALRGRWRELALVGIGFVAEQVLVTPHAALRNFEAISVKMFVVGGILLSVLAAVRQAPRWTHRYPMTLVLVLVFATFVAGALVAQHGIWPFYVAMCALPFAGAWLEWRDGTERHGRLIRLSIVLVVLAMTAVCSVFYVFAGGQFHDGVYRYRDAHRFAARVDGTHGVSLSSPSFALVHAMGLWPNQPVGVARRGLALWGDDERGPGICIPDTRVEAGRMRMCEYESWVQMEGARKCRSRLDTIDPDTCVSVDTADAYRLSLLTSPIHYRKHDEGPLTVSFQVRVCPTGEGARVLRPVVFPAYPLLPTLKLHAPGWGELTDDGGVRVEASAIECETLAWEWDGTGVPLVGWAQDRVLERAFDHLVFFVSERAAP